ncbi:glycosyltransferase family 2 protein [Candidatus Roizmanbacteria bacterium]|nr:glycosyltransferase family 2 protein [Candidatus Roizmanbacteria bacterium]
MQHQFIILAYKESPYLEACIQSLLRQTVKSEISISTSTPSIFLQRIAKKYGLKLVVNTERKGIAADWSFAYKIATAPYVTLVHQDDTYDSEFTKLCITENLNREESSILFSNYAEQIQERVIHNSHNLIVKDFILFLFFLVTSSLKNTAAKKLFLSFGSPIPCPAVTFHKAAIGPFQFNNSFHINLDWDAWLRLAELPGNFVYIKKRLVRHRIHSLSATTEGIASNVRYKEDKIMLEKIWPKPISAFLLFFYTGSYRSNKVEG